MRNKKQRILIIPLIILLLLIGGFISVLKGKINNTKPDTLTSKPVSIKYSDNLTAEINSKVNLLSFIKKVNNGQLFIADNEVDTSQLGEKSLWIAVKDLSDNIQTIEFNINITDSVAPQINCKSVLYTTVGKKINLLSGVSVSDNSGESITPSVSGDYSFDKQGTYALKYTAADSSGNASEVGFSLVVSPEKAVSTVTTSTKPTESASSKKPYYIVVNRDQNTVMVYSLSQANDYSVLAKTFVCSVGTGNNTPTGTFTTTDKYVWRKLVGGVYGQYATRITGSILFHSVPYFSQNKADLEYIEYNKLGSKASLGCVRLSVADAKWIYDNCPKGTTVKICDGPLPDGVIKPCAQTIDEQSPDRGWDPTDPSNPYKSK